MTTTPASGTKDSSATGVATPSTIKSATESFVPDSKVAASPRNVQSTKDTQSTMGFDVLLDRVLHPVTSKEIKTSSGIVGFTMMLGAMAFVITVAISMIIGIIWSVRTALIVACFCLVFSVPLLCLNLLWMINDFKQLPSWKEIKAAITYQRNNNGGRHLSHKKEQ
jgi:hypothetical protein